MDWKIIQTQIQIYPHPNADSLELGKAFGYQVVVRKGAHQDGDLILFIPEKSILPEYLATNEKYSKYLGGRGDRVKAATLRGEASMGIIIAQEDAPHIDFASLPLDEDVSGIFGITKYEPPIPTELSGKVQQRKSFVVSKVGSHDCQQHAVYGKEWVDGESIIVTEKIHGSQIILSIIDGEEEITSKGLNKLGLTILDSSTNFYWNAAWNTGLFEILKAEFPSGNVSAFGEMFPCQGGYTYGATQPTLRLFDVRIDGVSIPIDQLPASIAALWVPILYNGSITLDGSRIDKSILKLCEGSEIVSGRSLHIREGVVIRPVVDRFARDGKQLRLKVINPKYKETGEELS